MEEPLGVIGACQELCFCIATCSVAARGSSLSGVPVATDHLRSIAITKPRLVPLSSHRGAAFSVPMTAQEHNTFPNGRWSPRRDSYKASGVCYVGRVTRLATETFEAAIKSPWQRELIRLGEFCTVERAEAAVDDWVLRMGKVSEFVWDPERLPSLA